MFVEWGMLDNELRLQIQQAFGSSPRPEHFTDCEHCSECAEHDATLRSKDVDSLRREDLGNPGWDPMSFVHAQGFQYLFPALVRLALEVPGPEEEWYTPQLLTHLTNALQGQSNRLIQSFTREQRQAVVAFLGHLVETRSALADHWHCSDDLMYAFHLWSNASHTVVS